MRIFVLNRAAATTLIPQFPHAMISISTPDMGGNAKMSATDRLMRGQGPANLPETENRKKLHRVSFHDADLDRDATKRKTSLFKTYFTFDMARRIWEFVDTIPSAGEDLIVHCDGGLSRSPAIAAAIGKTLGGDDEYIFDRYNPNRFVYGMMMRTAGNRQAQLPIEYGDYHGRHQTEFKHKGDK